MLRPYEAMFIIRPQLEDELVEVVLKKVEDYITNNGGELLRSERKGKKRLAYEVKDQRDGHYALVNFNLDSGGITEFERFFRLTDEIIRHIILRQEEVGPILPKIATAPSAPPAVPAEV